MIANLSQHRTSGRLAILLLANLALFCGCSEDSKPADSFDAQLADGALLDASASDAASLDADQPDAAQPDAVTLDAMADAPLGLLPSTCSGACSTMMMTADFGATQRNFDRSYFGLSSPAQSTSGEWEVYIELNGGPDNGCPSKASPAPLYLISFTQLPLPPEGPPESVTTGVATLVDFEGALLTNSVFEAATSSTLRWTAADPCVACSEGTEPDRASRMLAFDVEISFASGVVEGHGYATHCDSLDQL